MQIATTQGGPASSRETIDLTPSKIIGVGRNYRDHAREMGASVPADPLLFLKAPTSLIGHGEPIVRPRGFDRVDFEGELGVVIGRRARRVGAGDALDHVLGYTCVNDVTVRDLQKRDGQWTRAKGMDSFCPLGPHIEVALDPSDLRIQTRVNGAVRQDDRTSSMVASVPALIAYISRYITLLPGDVIATGTPAGVGPIEPGDVIEIEIEGIGVLANRVVEPDFEAGTDSSGAG